MSTVDRLIVLERILEQTDTRIDSMLESKTTSTKELDLEYDYRATVQESIDSYKRKQNKKPNFIARLFRK